VSAVKVRAHRGYVALRARLGEQAPDPDRLAGSESILEPKPSPQGIK
jgi:hypothetical protein